MQKWAQFTVTAGKPTAALGGEDVIQPGPSQIDLDVSGGCARSLQSAMNAAPSPHLVKPLLQFKSSHFAGGAW